MSESTEEPTPAEDVQGRFSAGDQVRHHRVECLLASNRFVTRYGLQSGHWLLHFALPPELPSQRVQEWLDCVERLCLVGHPNLVTFVEVFQEGSDLFVVLENPHAAQLPDRPAARHVLHWASQLALVGCHLVEQGFPIGPALPRLEHLGVRDSQLVVGDPGLAELLWQGPESVSTAACIQRFGELLGELFPQELPANLAWIAARCQAKSGTGYADFSELAQAFRQALVVDVPETTRTGFNKVLPLLQGFQIPWLAERRRFPWHRLWLALALIAILYGAGYRWFSRPVPPRTYPAAVIGSGKRLLLVDLNSGITRRQLQLPSPVLATRLVANVLLVSCRGARQLLAFHIHTLEVVQGPAIDPDPAQMMVDRTGQLLYLLYPVKARVLVVKLPNTPVAYLDVLPGSDKLLPVELAPPAEPGLLVSSTSPARLRRYSVASRLFECDVKMSGIDNLAVDPLGGWWMTRDNRLERLSYPLEAGQSFVLPSPAQQLLAVGSRLVCTQPRGLAVLEDSQPPLLTMIDLQAAPRDVQPDPLRSSGVWLLEGKTLASLDLAGGRVIRRWPLSVAPETLTILP